MAKHKRGETMEIEIAEFCKLVAVLVRMLPRAKQEQLKRRIMPELQRMMVR